MRAVRSKACGQVPCRYASEVIALTGRTCTQFSIQDSLSKQCQAAKMLRYAKLKNFLVPADFEYALCYSFCDPVSSLSLFLGTEAFPTTTDFAQYEMLISTDGDGHRALTLRADDFPQVDNIGMVQILQQLDLPDGSDWKALLLSVHADLL